MHRPATAMPSPATRCDRRVKRAGQRIALVGAAALGIAAAAARADLASDLFAAAEMSSAGELHRVLEAGADPNARDDEGNAPLHRVVDPEPRWAPNKHDAPALRAAVDVLLAAGADPDAQGRHGATALHVAAYGGNAHAVAALLDGGADPHAGDSDRDTPLHWAVGKAGNARVIAALLGAGAQVSARNDSGNTALHLAAWHGHVDAIVALLEAGADPRAKNRISALGWAEGTPVAIAAERGHAEAHRRLRRWGPLDALFVKLRALLD